MVVFGTLGMRTSWTNIQGRHLLLKIHLASLFHRVGDFRHQADGKHDEHVQLCRSEGDPNVILEYTDKADLLYLSEYAWQAAVTSSGDQSVQYFFFLFFLFSPHHDPPVWHVRHYGKKHVSRQRMNSVGGFVGTEVRANLFKYKFLKKHFSLHNIIVIMKHVHRAIKRFPFYPSMLNQ